MYTAHFGLNAAPFSITPDPHYLYLSVRHREALAHLLYGVNEGPGFVLLTGEVGTGKTTLCRSLIEQLPDTVDVALLLNPRLTPVELLAALFDELRISYDSQYTLKDFLDTLNSYLLTAHAVGRRTVLIIDEAQNLSADVLEQVRLLTNLETSSHKLLQIILVGQPELSRSLKRNNLRQLAQRITARYHLLPLSAKDTQAYINHRLAISGAKNPLFTDAAMRLVYRYSKGVPRLINIICDRALLGGYVKNEEQIDTHTVRKGVQEVRGENIKRYSPLGWLTGLLATVLLVGALMWWWFPPGEVPLFESLFENSATPPQAELSLSSHEDIAPPTEPASPAAQQTPPPTPDLLSLLEKTSTELAFVTLFGFWDLDYTSLAGNKACQRAATQGLACLLRTGTWDELRRFNRPAVIELVTNEGKQYHLVVARLQGDTASLAIGGERFEFSSSEINRYWLGQFLLLWQPPMLPVPVMRAGISNEAVIWIRKHLDIIEGLRSEPHLLSPRFDRVLRRRVILFQRKQRLAPDGIVGEQTMLALQALAGGGPVLN
ncbi:MAG TPA: AAA family ATPase, partial [Thioploca sp.]|nr:AAA family ATPase [Thioploca sp.]